MEKTEEHLATIKKATSTRKKTILLVDDEAELLSLNKFILEMENYEVFTAESGTAAFEVLSIIHAPDLILLDMRMTDISGPDFLLMLEDKKPMIVDQVPIVFLTAMDQVTLGRAAGFIRKPFDIDEFLKAIQGFIVAGPTTKFIRH